VRAWSRRIGRSVGNPAVAAMALSQNFALLDFQDHHVQPVERHDAIGQRHFAASLAKLIATSQGDAQHSRMARASR